MKFSWLFLIFAFLSVTPLKARAEVFNPQTFTLDNDLQVIIVENHRAPVVNHMIVYRVGAKDEPVGKSGIAHFMEHLMFKGTKTVPTGEFSKRVRALGGRDNAYTTQDHTAYFQSIAREHLPLVMEMEADRMSNLTLTEEIVAVERNVILKERGQRIDNDPIGAFWEDVSNILFVNHPYATPVIGWRHEIETLSKYDIEQFYKNWYTPNNAILLITGAITLDDARILAEKYYGPVPKKFLPDPINTKMPILSGRRRLVQESKNIRQPLWSRHYIGPNATPENIAQADAATILADIIGGGATGKLYQSLVVEQKIATNAFISYNAQNIGPARFSIVATPADGVPLEDIESAVNIFLDEFFKTGVTADEVTKTTQGLKIQSIYARDSLSGPAVIIGRALGSGLDIKTIEDWPNRMDRVTEQSVNTVARQILLPQETVPVTGIMLTKTKKKEKE